MSFLFSSAHPLTGFRSSIAQSKRGFALLITVTLLAFLVLLLVSLAALTRVETQVANNNQKLAQARQNAIMALNIAVGQLQKYAGVDTKVTARAEITSTSVITNPYFTGVWDAANTSEKSADMWLVSGSERAGASASNLLSGALSPSNDATSDDEVFLVGNQSVAANPLAPTAAEKQKRIKIAKENIMASGGSVPGLPPSETPRIGRYGWWIGDEGSKASLALADRAEEVTYAPWYDVSSPTPYDQRGRIRQQIGSGPCYFRAAGASTTLVGDRLGFDPLISSPRNILFNKQIGLMPTLGTTSAAAFAGTYYHDFTSVAYNVQANTRTDGYRGLMEDLSLNPAALGSAFVKYVDYESYMEGPGVTSGAIAAIPEIKDPSSPRRRYLVTTRDTSSAVGLPEISFNVAPVLTDFILQYFVRRSGPNQLEVKARLYVSLWNPYSAAIVPPADLGLQIEGLDASPITVSSPSPGSSVQVNLANGISPIFVNKKLTVMLPFGKNYRASASSGYGKNAELASWLPGRKYSWASPSVADGGSGSNVMRFYSNMLDTVGWVINTPVLAGAAENLSVAIPAVSLRVNLVSGSNILATYSPATYPIDAIPDIEDRSNGNNGAVTPSKADDTGNIAYWKFGFTFRLKQPSRVDLDRSWLTEFDPRGAAIPPSALIPFDDVSDYTPTQSRYNMKTTDGLNDYLLYRPQGYAPRQVSVFNDVSLFELPRLPLLSIGELQHLQIKDTRPYSIGNSWGEAANVVFDRFFFSGLPPVSSSRPTPNLNSQPLPNWNLRVTREMSADDVRADSFSSQHLLQGGGFNVNSISQPAWRAVLMSVRYNPSDPAKRFARADINNDSISTPNPDNPANMGTQTDADALRNESFDRDITLGPTGTYGGPAFFRLPQSAQEIYFWGDPATSSLADNVRRFSSEAFRYGVRGYADAITTTTSTAATSSNRAMAPAYTTAAGGQVKPANMSTGPNLRSLTTDQIEVLATKISGLVRQRTTSKGPFRSLEEFLRPESAGNPSLLERAIEESRMNPDQIRPVNTVSDYAYSGFSTLTITQGDILTALAPYLHTRSDTFIIRTYGESVNPVTGATEGKAWLEARVQRFPEVVASGDSITQPNINGFGRRFKITNFRWLSQSDI